LDKEDVKCYEILQGIFTGTNYVSKQGSREFKTEGSKGEKKVASMLRKVKS